MTDEITTTQDESTTPAPETVVEEPKAPELNDEAIAAYLGVDADFFTKEVKPQAKGLDKLYAKLNAERAKQGRTPAPAPAAEAADEDDVELDARSKKILDKYIEEKIMPLAQFQQTILESEFEAVVDEFSKEHKDVPPDKVNEVMEELGLWSTNNPSQLGKNLRRAYKLAKADLFDPDAEVDRKLAERLAASKDDEAEVVEVKPKRVPQPEAHDEAAFIADPNIPWDKKLEMMSR